MRPPPRRIQRPFIATARLAQGPLQDRVKFLDQPGLPRPGCEEAACQHAVQNGRMARQIGGQRGRRSADVDNQSISWGWPRTARTAGPPPAGRTGNCRSGPAPRPGGPRGPCATRAAPRSGERSGAPGRTAARDRSASAGSPPAIRPTGRAGFRSVSVGAKNRSVSACTRSSRDFSRAHQAWTSPRPSGRRSCQPLIVLGQAVGLGVVHHLDAVFDVAMVAVMRRQFLCDVPGIQFLAPAPPARRPCRGIAGRGRARAAISWRVW